jgi:hypothetical protein
MYTQTAAWSSQYLPPEKEPDSQPPGEQPASSLAAARQAARRELVRAGSCGCCDSLVAHVFQRLGSTLFLDEDPVKLTEMFPAGERVFITPRVIAACILLTGRERIELHPKEQSRTWPSLRMLSSSVQNSPAVSTESGPVRVSPRHFHCCAPEVQSFIEKSISKAQERAEREKDPRLTQAIAYLWAAAHTLESAGS